jgi:hypothetical protein
VPTTAWQQCRGLRKLRMQRLGLRVIASHTASHDEVSIGALTPESIGFSAPETTPLFRQFRYRSSARAYAHSTINSRHKQAPAEASRLPRQARCAFVHAVARLAPIVCLTRLRMNGFVWPPHFGGSKPLLRQRSAMAGDVSAVMKAPAAAGPVLLNGMAAA